MKPLIGITTGEIKNQHEPWEPHIYGQKHHYSDAIIAAGGIPVFIPMIPEAELQELYARLDGILFAGGNDIDPQLYGQIPEPETKNVTPLRDKTEMLLMSWALADNKPLFAICRGYQLFNVLLGGTLYQDIAKALPEAHDHEFTTQKKDYTSIAHHLKIDPTSQLAYITQSLEIGANSRHHQAVKHVAHELRAVAWSEDGLVEGLEHPMKTFAIGVQCHPESLWPADQKWAAVFRAFVTSTQAHPAPKKRFNLKKLIKVKK